MAMQTQAINSIRDRDADPVRLALVVPTSGDITRRARAFVIAHIARELDAPSLMRATGVGERALRGAILAETGLRLAGFVLGLRLDRARAWLSSDRESRSQQQIARALGFRSSAAFGRAYRRRFGETMAATRLRAVRLGEAEAGVNKDGAAGE
jgi:AraC-like DNA-binding protein